MIQFPNEIPILRGRKAVLRPIEKKDDRVYFQIRTMDASMKYLGKAKYQNMDEVYKWMEWIKGEFENKKAIVWCIADAESDEMLGYATIFKIDYNHHYVFVGYALHPNHFRKGIMSESLPLILDYAFDTMNAHRIEANIDKRNEGSERLLIKNGFKKEAHMTESFYFDGEYLDSVIYGLVKGWPRP